MTAQDQSHRKMRGIEPVNESGKFARALAAY
jgi:hypothetical protein